jgi:hypothetical protein
VKRWLFFSFVPLTTLLAAATYEEALALRRIADFWEEGEVQIAKGEIEEFLRAFPESEHRELLAVALGDVWVREKEFGKALEMYATISREELKEKVFLHRMRCLYELQWYATLADECEAHLSSQALKGEEKLQATFFLAIGLYHQCLNASGDPELMKKLASRAVPHFETLIRSDLSAEVAQAFAHLLCATGDYERAADIYLDLAAKGDGEEFLFRAAIVEAEFDKERSFHTFNKIATNGREKRGEALFNQLILLAEMGQASQILAERGRWIDGVPPEKKGYALASIGRAALQLGKGEIAVADLRAALAQDPLLAADRGLLLALVKAGELVDDVSAVEMAESLFEERFKQDPDLDAIRLSKALIQRRQRLFPAAHRTLDEVIQRKGKFTPEALLEKAQISLAEKDAASVYALARDFVAQFPTHELAKAAWLHLGNSSLLLYAGSGNGEALIGDLEELLAKAPALTADEKGGWSLALAKAYYDKKEWEKAEALCKEVQQWSISPVIRGNALLLTAFCEKERLGDSSRFAEQAEQALALGADLIPKGTVYLSLYNAAVSRELPEEAAAIEALYQAFVAGGKIESGPLSWLALKLAELAPGDPESAQRGIAVCQTLISRGGPQAEEWTARLAEFYRLQGEEALLSDLAAGYSESTSPDIRFYWALHLARVGKEEEALRVWDDLIAHAPTLRSKWAANAALYSAKIRKRRGALSPQEKGEIASQLKTVVLHKRALNEPTHLEAALDYIDLIAEGDPAKRLALIERIEREFSTATDLVSREYQEGLRAIAPLYALHQKYLRFLSADRLLAEAAALQGKERELKQRESVQLFEQLAAEAPPLLKVRIAERLKRL